MKLQTMTQNMAIATYTHNDPDKQVVTMAKRYKAKSLSPSIRKTLDRVILAPLPSLLVSRVYSEVCG